MAAHSLALLGLAWAASALAAPFTPASDSEVVQPLPIRWSAAAREQRARLARNPQQLPLALATAQAAILRGRSSGDPRELGLAQAALAPWWTQPAPPPPVRLLRATVLQSQHHFAPALADLRALAEDPATPLAVRAQAGLTQVAVLQATGRLAQAQQVCTGLAGRQFAALGAAVSVPAQACAAELRSLLGQPRQAAADLAALAREAPGDRWLTLLRAELAQRLGDAAAAQALFTALDDPEADVYTRAARADWLLEQGRPRDVLRVVTPAGPEDADALLLRRAIALQALGDPQAIVAARTLQARLDAARQRGENRHAREEARLALDVLGQPARALELALNNWQQQQEPADAVLLWRAAQASGRPEAAAPVRRWASDPARVDVRLAGLAAGAAP